MAGTAHTILAWGCSESSLVDADAGVREQPPETKFDTIRDWLSLVLGNVHIEKFEKTQRLRKVWASCGVTNAYEVQRGNDGDLLTFPQIDEELENYYAGDS